MNNNTKRYHLNAQYHRQVSLLIHTYKSYWSYLSTFTHIKTCCQTNLVKAPWTPFQENGF